MKKTFILFALLLIPSLVRADWYVVNKDNQVVAKPRYEPDHKDLESRGETAIFLEKNIPLENAEYRGGKISEKSKVEEVKKKAKEAI